MLRYPPSLFLFRLSETLCAVLRVWEGRGGSVEGCGLTTAHRGVQRFLRVTAQGARVGVRTGGELLRGHGAFSVRPVQSEQG